MENEIIVVKSGDGQVAADSRDVAANFGKRHDHVLRDIDAMTHSPDLGDVQNQWFSEISTPHPTVPGRYDRHVMMTRQGFTLLAMGWTGPKAMAFKVKYIQAFDAMEAEIAKRDRPDPVDLTNPRVLEALLLENVSKRIEAEKRAVRAEESEKTLKVEKAVLEPKAEALDLISESEGSMTITEASKVLEVKRNALVSLLEEDWMYRSGRDKKGALRGRSEKLNQGLLEHKFSEIPGVKDKKCQVRITHKGLTVLARALRPSQPRLI